LQVEHIIPRKRWSGPIAGLDHPDNLAAAWERCNTAKGAAIQALDWYTGTSQPRFHPRRDLWEEHFSWSEDFLRIRGIRPIGRATEARLKLNRRIYREQRELLREANRLGRLRWP
jgi:5-methylcytosine-specific restriction endonuclease McrA